MPRLARIVIPGVPHHISHRGNNRQDIFFVGDDRKAYLRFLKEHAERFGLRVWGYCLMTHHIHLVATPETEDALGKAVGRAHFRYTQHINRLHGRSGHLWEGRFHSCALDEEHFWMAMRYVEQNPVRAGIAAKPWEYPWSSAESHILNEPEDGLLDHTAWRELMEPSDWRKLVGRRVRKSEGVFLRRNTERGWPLASDSILAKFEKLLGRRVRPLDIGRPFGASDKKKRKRRKTNR